MGLSQGDIADLEWLFQHAEGDVSGLHAAPIEPVTPRTREVRAATDVQLQRRRDELDAVARGRRLERIRDRLLAAPDGGVHWAALRRLYGRPELRDRVAYQLWGRTGGLARLTGTLRLSAVDRARRAEILRQRTVAHRAAEMRARAHGGSAMAEVGKLLEIEGWDLVVQVDPDLAVDELLEGLSGKGHEAVVTAVRSELRELQRASEAAYVEARRAVFPKAKDERAREADRWLAA